METTNLTNLFGLSELPHGSYEFGGKAFTTQELWIKIAEKINILIEHFNYLDKSVTLKIELFENGLSYVNMGGSTNERPVSPPLFSNYFDTDLNRPIWFNGTKWIDVNGNIV